MAELCRGSVGRISQGHEAVCIIKSEQSTNSHVLGAKAAPEVAPYTSAAAAATIVLRRNIMVSSVFV